MVNKKLGLLVLSILFIVFVFSSFVMAQQRTESVTAAMPLPVPRLVTDRQFVVGFILAGLSSESSQRWNKQTQIEATHRGWKLISMVDATTAELTRNAFENLINQDVDAVIFRGISIEGSKDLIIKAREKGIGVYNLDLDLREGSIVDVTQPGGVAGAKISYFAIVRLNRIGNVLILNQSSELIHQRTFVGKALVENVWPTLKLLGFETMRYPGWEKDSFDMTQNYLTKYNNNIQWIFAAWDTPGIFAARAVEEAGLTRKDCFITGIDGGTQAYSEIRKGSPFIATMSQPFEAFVHILFEVINQVQVEGIAPGDPDSMVPIGRTIYEDTILTTPENVPARGTVIHELFANTYYDPNDKDAWYFWGDPYKAQ